MCNGFARRDRLSEGLKQATASELPFLVDARLIRILCHLLDELLSPVSDIAGRTCGEPFARSVALASVGEGARPRTRPSPEPHPDMGSQCRIGAEELKKSSCELAAPALECARQGVDHQGSSNGGICSDPIQYVDGPKS